MKTEYVTANELGSCPAAVRMADGVVEINIDVWNRYDDFEQRFILMHEEGHYVQQTDSEEEADAYALHKVYKTATGSLKRSVLTLYKVGIIDRRRLESLYAEALKIDWQSNGNVAAKMELEKIKRSIMNKKLTLSTSPFIQRNRVSGQVDIENIKKIADNTNLSYYPNTTMGVKGGINLLGYHFTMEAIALFSIALVLFCKLK